MKNKFKKVLPLMMCFMIAFGSCMSVNAAPVYVPILDSGDSYRVGWENKRVLSSTGEEIIDHTYYDFTITSGSDVKVILCEYPYVSGIIKRGPLLVSLNSFTYKSTYYMATLKGNQIHDFDVCTCPKYSNPEQNSLSFTYNGETYYYSDYMYYGQSGLITDWTDPFIYMSDYVDGYFDTSSVKGSFLEILLNDENFSDELVLEYAPLPSAAIESPKNLSIYRGYSTADRQYKFQMQWDKPLDTSLNAEIMYKIHWKDGVLGFGDHVYRNYKYLTYDSGISAQNNKLSYLEDDFLKAYFESQDMELPSVYNIEEIYVRFAKEIDGVVQYSLWRKVVYTNLDEGNGYDDGEDDFIADSTTGAFDTNDNWIDQSVSNGEIVNGSDKENSKSPGLDADGNNISPPKIDDINPDTWDEEYKNVFDAFTNVIGSAIEFVGEFPSMISEFFGFLPSGVLGCLTIGLLGAILLRFLGR